MKIYCCVILLGLNRCILSNKIFKSFLYWGCASVTSLPRCLSFIHPSQVVLWYGAAVCLSVHHPFVHVCLSVPLSIRPYVRLSSVCLWPYICMYMSFIHLSQVVLWYGAAVCLSVHPSICSHLPVCPSFGRLVSVSVHAYVCTWVLYTCHRLYYGMVLLSVSLSIHRFVDVCPSVRTQVHFLSVSVRTYVCTYVGPSIQPFFCVYIFLSVCQSAHMIFVPHPFWWKKGD